MIDWSKPVTFDACYKGFDVNVSKVKWGYRIITAGYRYDVDQEGKAFATIFKEDCFNIRNT